MLKIQITTIFKIEELRMSEYENQSQISLENCLMTRNFCYE
jgi:hypothetical protein